MSFSRILYFRLNMNTNLNSSFEQYDTMNNSQNMISQIQLEYSNRSIQGKKPIRSKNETLKYS